MWNKSNYVKKDYDMSKCGNVIDDDANFCEECGVKIEQVEQTTY